MSEGMGQLGQRLLTDTEKVWIVGYGQTFQIFRLRKIFQILNTVKNYLI